MKLDQMLTGNVSGFQFSAVRPETLGATEYTLVTLTCDKTGSLSGFEAELLKVKQAVVEACRKSPRADFLLLRVVEFNSQVDEVHGFLPLSQIDPAQYAPPACCGSTALFDATYASVAATNAYARQLGSQDYFANAIAIVVTDGDDNQSRMAASDVAKELATARTSESLESFRTILVGIDAAQCKTKLEAFQVEATIDEYLDVGDVTPGKLAKLALFISRSISAQSQALGTGGPSQSLTF